MKISRIVFLVAIVVSIVLVGKATEAQAGPVPNSALAQVAAQGTGIASTGANPNQGQVESLSGSLVTFTPAARHRHLLHRWSPANFLLHGPFIHQ